MIARSTLLLIAAVSLVSCGTTSTVRRDIAPSLVWETRGFVAPESVVFDGDSKQFYVSNMGSWGEGATPGDGFISRVSADGQVIEQKWVTGLENPKGLALANGRLYVGDHAELVEIDPTAGRITARHRPADGGPGGFNDCTADPSGNVYVFSRRLSTVFRLRKGQFEAWAKIDAKKAGGPNGLLAERDRLLLGGWVGHDAEGRETGGHLSVLRFSDRTLERLGTQPLGQIDGIEPDGRGAYSVTDWTTGRVLHVSSDGTATTLMTLQRGAADHEYVVEQRLLVIPMVLDDVVRAYRWAP